MTRAVAHYDPQFGPAFHIGGNITAGRPIVRADKLSSYQSPTGFATRAMAGVGDPRMPRMRAPSGPRVRMSDFFSTTEVRQGSSSYSTNPIQPSYSAYGPQRMTGPVVRRNPRMGWVPGMSDFVTLGAGEDTRPDPASTLASFVNTWVNGTVLLKRGEWNFVGYNANFPHLSDEVTLNIIGAYGTDGDIMVTIGVQGAPANKPGIPTTEYPGGINSFSLRAIAASGEWRKPGVVGTLAKKLGVTPFLLSGAALLAIGAAWYMKKSHRKNPCGKRRNPWFVEDVTTFGDTRNLSIPMKSRRQAKRLLSARNKMAQKHGASGDTSFMFRVK